MSVPKTILEAKGSWFGTSKLHLSWMPKDKQVTESGSFFHVETDGRDKYATLTYSWHYEDRREEGTMIVAMDAKSKKVEIGWCDSWHQSTGVMFLTGEVTSDTSFKTKGNWTAEGEVWGWTIELILINDQLKMKMEVITAKGEVDWAVDAVYARH